MPDGRVGAGREGRCRGGRRSDSELPADGWRCDGGMLLKQTLRDDTQTTV